MEVATKGKAKRRHLSAADCDDLRRSAGGANALTRPAGLSQGSCGSSRGLHPRTPTKRRKCASASESPSGQQKSISSFFSVTGILTSSPHKTAQPCSSKSTNGVNVELFPNSDEDEEDEDEDVSLLAASMAAEPDLDEQDDVSLLEPNPATKQNVTDDYLEGMTPEMFGEDEEFDHFGLYFPDEGEKEVEVEALPDKHFGLLGNNAALQEPQGCMEDLPEEVLRQVLSLVPAQDLYRSAMLVCHRWRDIIMDAKFVPFKKKYFRFMMWEKEAELEIFTTLQENNIIKPAPSQHSIRQLVVLMAQHKVGQRVRPEDVLECVKKHRLFPQAEASIRLRIPDIKKNFDLGLEGPNPYAAMAVILLLCESVGDVQSLVSHLTGCMSHTAITEYLNHMALMLLALRRYKVRVSNRLHYNIYYVLHLMENGPFSVGSGENGRPQMALTGEQQHILSHDIKADHVVKIVAFAGTGKTTTLVKYAEQRPHLRFLYVAFNKSVAAEAQRRFPSNVDCKTVHSLAFGDVGKIYQLNKKLTFNLKPFALSSALPKNRGGYKKAKVVAMTLNTYMASVDQTISASHVPLSTTNRKGEEMDVNPMEIPYFASDAKMIWNKMKDHNAKEHEAYYMTHDGYLKLWQLQHPKPQLSDQYDVIFIDEAQDCTPAIMDVLLSQRCGKVLVGDPHQQIYTFKGAVNALQTVNHTHIYYLTQSFRFGSEIAYVGATILKVCKSVDKILVGGKQKGGVCDETAEKAAAAVRQGVSPCPGKTAILSRTNLTVFTQGVTLTDANPQCTLHFVGGVQSIGLTRILDIWQLTHGSEEKSRSPGQKPFIKDPLIRAFSRGNKNGYWALKKYIDATDDKELESKVLIVEKYNKRIPELVKRLDQCHVDNFNRADFILGTVHKAKGLEFDTVMITSDFIKVPSSRHNLHRSSFSFRKVPSDEWNLLYVAVTRAKTSLIITQSIRRILTMAGEYFLKSDMPKSLMKDGEPLPCCIRACPNCTTPGSAFIMSKREIKCTDDVSLGGPLCERCVWTRIGPTAFLMTDDVHSMAEIPEGFHPPVHHVMLLGLL